MIAIALSTGIYHTREAYFTALQEAGRDQHPDILRCFGVKHVANATLVSYVGVPGNVRDYSGRYASVS